VNSTKTDHIRLEIRLEKMILSKRALSQMVKYKVILLKILNHYTSLEEPLYKCWDGSLCKRTKLRTKKQKHKSMVLEVRSTKGGVFKWSDLAWWLSLSLCAY